MELSYIVWFMSTNEASNISLKVNRTADNRLSVHSNIAEGYTRRTVETTNFMSLP